MNTSHQGAQPENCLVSRATFEKRHALTIKNDGSLRIIYHDPARIRFDEGGRRYD